MFFILKDEKTVIAADNAFMEKAGVESIYLLAELFRVGEFPRNDAEHTCHIDGKDEVFTKTPVQTLFGEAFLYDFSRESVAEDAAISEEATQVLPEDEETLDVLETASNESEVPLLTEEETSVTDEETLSLLDEEPEAQEPVTTPETLEVQEESERLELIPEASESTPSEEHSEPAEETHETDATLTDLSLGTAAAAGAAVLLSEEKDLSLTQEEVLEEKDDLFELLDLDEEETLKSSTESEASPAPETDQAPSNEPEPAPEEKQPPELPEPSTHEAIIPIAESPAQTPFADYEQNAQLIGISFEEYAGFLSQFVDESLEHESDLKGNDLRLFRENVTSLKDASQLLHLPRLTDKLRETEEATSDEKSTLLDDFFAMIRHIQTDLKQHNTQAGESQIHPTTSEIQPSEEETTAPEPDESLPESAPLSTETESILDHVTPLPFDFSARVAADELGLPEPLVEEFVLDFVKQAKENIPVFEQAQQNGDMETIQKTAHLLKGAASNLRIDPLAKTLEELQHNEDAKKIPDLFQRFVGQLKALDNFIHAPGM